MFISIVSVQDMYLQAILKAYVYANFTQLVYVEPRVLPLVEMIRDLMLQSNNACGV